MVKQGIQAVKAANMLLLNSVLALSSQLLSTSNEIVLLPTGGADWWLPVTAVSSLQEGCSAQRLL